MQFSLLSHCCYTSSHSVLHFITLILLEREYQSWSSDPIQFCYFSLGIPNILLPKTFGLYLSLNVTDKTLQPHKTTGRTAPYVFFRFCFHGSTVPVWSRSLHYRGFTITLKTHHARQDSPGRVIRPKQRPVPHNTQHSQETAIHAPEDIRTHNPSKRAATAISLLLGGRREGNVPSWYQQLFP